MSITVYTKPACVQCNATYRALDKAGLEYDIIDISELGWQVRGNVLAFDFEVVDAGERVLATAHRKLVSVHGRYDVVVNDEAHVDELVALFVVVNHIIQNRSNAEMTSISSSGSN